MHIFIINIRHYFDLCPKDPADTDSSGSAEDNSVPGCTAEDIPAREDYEPESPVDIAPAPDTSAADKGSPARFDSFPGLVFPRSF